MVLNWWGVLSCSKEGLMLNTPASEFFFLRWPILIANLFATQLLKANYLEKYLLRPKSWTEYYLLNLFTARYLLAVISGTQAMIYTPGRQLHCQRKSSHPTTQLIIAIAIVIARIGHSPWGFSGPILQYFLRLLGEIGRQLI